MPRLRLTAQHVDSLRAIDGKRTDYVDVIVPSLVLRVTPEGSRSWSVRMVRGSRREGRKHLRITLGKTDRLTLAQARAEARALLERASRGEPARRPGLTVDDLLEQALKALQLAPSTRKEWGRLKKAEISPKFGGRQAAELQRADVRAWMRDIALRSRWTANRAFELLRRVYSWGIAEELLAPPSPCDHVPKFEDRSNTRVLSREELRRLMGALHRLRECWPAYADCTLLLLYTGVRRDSAVGLRREELVDLEGAQPRWLVPEDRSKSGRVHLVPLSAAAVEVVKRRIVEVDGIFGGRFAHLFPVGGNQVGKDLPMRWSSNWVEELVEEMRPVSDDWTLGTDPRWTIHGFRHTLATHLIEDLGVPRHVVSLLLGHAMPGPASTRVYDRAELLPDRRAALERWADWLEGLAKAGARKDLADGKVSDTGLSEMGHAHAPAC